MTGGEPTFVHLRGGDTSVVLSVGRGVPVIVHWGSSLGDVDLAGTVGAADRGVALNVILPEAPLSVIPEHGAGFPGRPGLEGHRLDGSGGAPRFLVNGVSIANQSRLVVEASDSVAGLRVRVELSMDGNGVLAAQNIVWNEGDAPYLLTRLGVTLPLPDHATEIGTFTGRWAREFSLQRRPWVGTVAAENRKGRTSHDHLPALFAGSGGFGEWHGHVWGVHLAWSGNHAMHAEVLSDGRRYVHAAELLASGEVVLAPGESYATPWVLAAFSPTGLTEVSRAFHRHLRSRPGHPTADRPRKVLLNTWEAVYFDHDHDALWRLAERAAAVGAERFVLDDGWFHLRRHDDAGLGDWWVDPAVYPDGLTPLIEHVQRLGMDFGLWVEPEAVNPDSDLYRAHPEWVLAEPGYEPPLSRNQLALDLADPECWAYLLERLDALLREHDIAYLKWDMNRDLIGPAHAQTLALYALIDELNERHPHVEIESCSSGGGRADAEVLRRTRRVWTSDCNDALERVAIQRGFSMVFPPEVMGAHIGPPHSHTTGRHHGLAFRAVTALFGHLGIEWDVLRASEADLAALTDVIALHKRLRPLLHGGDVIRVDHPDPAAVVHGVVSTDRRQAVVAYTQVTTSVSSVPAALRVPDLDPALTYDVRYVWVPGAALGLHQRTPSWWPAGGLVLTGRQLAAHGFHLPVMGPESALLFELHAQ